MKTRLGIMIGCIIIFLSVGVQQASASHLCGQPCNQFTDQGACTHGCSVPGAQPNPDYRNPNDYKNEETHATVAKQAETNQATAAIVIQQAVAAGVEANIAVQVLQTQYGVANAAETLKAVEQLNVAAAEAPKGCQGAGCCLINNCGANQYCAGADPGHNQYGQCVDGKNEPRSGTEIAKAFIDAGGSSAAVTANPLAFLGETDYDKMQGKNGQTVTSLENILSGIKGVANTAAAAITQSNTATQADTLPDAWKMSVGGTCSDSNLMCGDVSKGTGFCVPNGVGGTKTCNDYFLQFGFNVQTGGYSVVLGSIPDGCDGDTSKKVVQCPSGTYSVCTKFTNDTYKCYLKGSPVPNSFTISENNQCLTSKGDAIIAGYYCQGIDNVGRTNGCQNPVPGFSDGSKSKICVGDIARNICGVVQIDASGTSRNGFPEDYSINVFSTAGCRTVVPPTTTVFVPPQNIPPCTTNCGSSTPPSSPTPPQSPAPPGSPVCLGETSSISAPQLGQSPVFTCTPASQATRYEFQWKLGSGAYQSLAPNATGSNVSVPLLVNSSGTHTIQCRPCNANGCANWDNL